MFFQRIKTPGIAHVAYVIGDGGEAAVVDPRRDVEEYLRVARENRVLTCPFELRARLGFDAPLLGELSAAVNDCILRFYERALQPRTGMLPAVDGPSERRRKLHGGTVTVVQRVSSDLRLNPHLHLLALDGVFAEQPDAPPRSRRRSRDRLTSSRAFRCSRSRTWRR